MRPIKLTMSAFGPYAEQTVIDFNKLGENGLYLITGTTGAGKTSIFDAIVYALYDKPSGDVRDSSMFRSKYAAPSAETYVELEFSCKGKNYKVKRSPEYERTRIRGNGTSVKQNPKAELQTPERTIAKSKKEVNQAIEEILGINRDQFLQIAMIAQGDFLKLLLAKTEERIHIFRQIFKTQSFEKIQSKLKDDSKKLYGQWMDCNKEVLAYAKNMTCYPHHQRCDEVELAKAGKLPTEKIMELLHLFMEEDREIIDRLQGNCSRLEKSLEIINNNIGKAEEYQKNTASYEEKKQRIRTVQSNYDSSLVQYEAEKQKLPEQEKLNKEIAMLEMELPQYNTWERLGTELTALNEKLKKDGQNLENNRELFRNQEQKLKQLKEKQKIFENAGAQKEKFSSEMKQLQNLQSSLEKLFNDLNDHDKLCYDLRRHQNEYSALSFDAAKAMEKYNLAHLAFLNEQAGIMAQTLQEGMPCPVCGSVHHPHLAQTSESAPSETELKAAKKIAEDMQKKAEKKSAECANLKGKIDAETERIQKVSAEICEECDWKNLKETVIRHKNDTIKKLSAVKESIMEENQRIRTKETVDREIPLEEKILEQIRSKNALLEQTMISIKEKISNKEEQRRSLRTSLHFENKTSADAHLNILYLKMRRLKKSMEAATISLTESEKELSVLRGEISSLEKVLESVCNIDFEKEKANREQCLQHHAKVREELNAAHARLHTNTQCLESIHTSAQKALALEQQYRMVNNLSETANGNLSGREKIMLETYVQMRFFDRILYRANIRLRFMTNNQYELLRHKPKDEYRSQTGLDLDVKDYYNGTIRPVNSLSGGEAFKASLSLALGLSDEIQSSSGGVRLDTMFVDEGFGSLDDESLKLAIHALMELTEGNRLVGIISHVNELKTKIEKQILVTKELSGGSHCQIIT
ncbi:MAG: SMC family ATPase [Clostridia bacterium]|nr:SMC family ATPase [Clostridia bacterium]